jgi:membrane protein DedA with SNARE-associated domain
MDALRPLFDWLADHTYFVVFVGTLIDATGFPFPGRLLLVGAGALAATGHAHVLVVIGLAALAAMIVDQIWYLTITRGSSWLIGAYYRMKRRQGVGTEEAADYFRRYGAATIVLGRFFTTVRVVAWPLAASHGVGYGRFIVLDAIGATLWASIWALLGWFVGEHWESTAQSMGVWTVVAGTLVATAVVGPLLLRLRRRRPRAV